MITGVHDSYWTHACDVDELSRILREKFIELYETPILENVESLHFLDTHLLLVLSRFLGFHHGLTKILSMYVEVSGLDLATSSII